MCAALIDSTPDLLVGIPRDRGLEVQAAGLEPTLLDAGLVGRSSLAAEALAHAGAGRSVLLIGPAGVGKTALAEFVAGHVAADHRLAVEDLDRLDGAALSALSGALLSGSSTFVMTSRVGSRGDAGDLLHWWKDGLVVRLDVAPLGDDDVDQLARTLVGGPIESSTRSRLRVLSGGNPRWLHAVIDSTRSADAWRQVAGLWRLPPSAVGALDARGGLMGQLAADELLGLVLLATLGELDAPLLDAGTAALVSVEAHGGTAARLLEAGLVSTVDIGPARETYRLNQPLVGAVARAAVDPRDLATGARQVSTALEDRGEISGRRFAESCHHGGRDDTVAVDAMAAEAELTAMRNDFTTAERLARAVWERRADLVGVSVLVTVLEREGRFDEAIELGQVALARPLADGDGMPYTQVGVSVAMAQFLRDDAARAVELLRSVEAQVPVGGLRSFVVAQRARIGLFSGALEDAERIAAGLDVGPGDPGETITLAALGEAASVRSHAAVLLGQPVDAERWLSEALDLHFAHPEMSSPFNVGHLYLVRVLAQAAAGDLVGAQTALDLVRPMLDALDSPYAIGYSRLVRGRVAGWSGDEQAAAEHFAEAALALSEAHRPGLARMALAGAAGTLSRLGRDDEAAVAAAELAAIDRDGVRFGDAGIARELAWMRHGAGALSEARRLLDDALTFAPRMGSALDAAEVLLDRARLGDLSGCSQLEDLADGFQGSLVGGWAAGTRALALGDPEGLASAAEAFERLGARQLAAEWWGAVATATSGDAASSAARQATALASAPGTPMITAIERPALTARERELAELSVAGFSRAAIAAQLGISARTVDSHLQRVCQKLGVQHRRELGTALG